MISENQRNESPSKPSKKHSDKLHSVQSHLFRLIVYTCFCPLQVCKELNYLHVDDLYFNYITAGAIIPDYGLWLLITVNLFYQISGKSSDDEKTEDVPLGQCPVSPDRKGRKGGKDADSEWKIAVTFFGGFFVGLILGIAIYDGYKRRKRRLAYNSLNGDERRNQLESNA